MATIDTSELVRLIRDECEARDSEPDEFDSGLTAIYRDAASAIEALVKERDEARDELREFGEEWCLPGRGSVLDDVRLVLTNSAEFCRTAATRAEAAEAELATICEEMGVEPGPGNAALAVHFSRSDNPLVSYAGARFVGPDNEPLVVVRAALSGEPS